VARLYTDGSFAARLAGEFASFDRLEFHLAPPLLGRRDAAGQPVKSAYGPWIFSVFRILAGLRFIRGTPIDIFGYSDERRRERSLLTGYEADIAELVARLSADSILRCIDFANYPNVIRGFGHIKKRNIEKAIGIREKQLKAVLSEYSATPLVAE